MATMYAVGQNRNPKILCVIESLAYWGICINTFTGLGNFLGQVQRSVTLWSLANTYCPCP